jgi:hypothetical protein
MTILNKAHNWLIAFVVGKKPVVANVELSLKDPIFFGKSALMLKVQLKN